MSVINKPAPPVVYSVLLNPLYVRERNVLSSILAILHSDARGVAVREAITALDSLIEAVEDGYPLRSHGNAQVSSMRYWRKQFQRLLEWMTGPEIRQDRLAIALAYCRDGIGGYSRQCAENLTPMEDLLECRRQLTLLTAAPAPTPTPTPKEYVYA